jgi:hypothetical protein
LGPFQLVQSGAPPRRTPVCQIEAADAAVMGPVNAINNAKARAIHILFIMNFMVLQLLVATPHADSFATN